MKLLFRPTKSAVSSVAVQNFKCFSTKENVHNDTKSMVDWGHAKTYDSMPGPKPLPLIGNLRHFLPYIGRYAGLESHKMFQKIREDYGNIAKFSGLLFRNDLVFVYDPNDMETIFRNDGQWPVRAVLPSLRHYREQRKEMFGGFMGIFTSDGEEWLSARSTVNPIMMQPRVVKFYTNPVNDVTDDFVNRVKNLAKASPVSEMSGNFAGELNKWALENICAMGLDIRLGLLDDVPNPKAEAFVKANLQLFDTLYALDVKTFSIWRFISTPTYRRYMKSMDEMLTYVMENCEKALNNLDKSKPENEMTVFEKLLKKDKYIAISAVSDMMIAGIDTTSRTACSMLYFLATNPEAQEQLRNEVMKMMPDPNAPVTSQILDNLPYMRATIKETMRLSPIGAGIQRQTQKDLVLSGYQIPKGVNVILCNFSLCLEDKYFPEAKKFIPDRWLRKDGSRNVDINPFVYFPFGFGPRMCVGKRLASLELEVLLVKIIRNFKMEWHHEEAKFSSTLLYGLTSPLKIRMIPLAN